MGACDDVVEAAAYMVQQPRECSRLTCQSRPRPRPFLQRRLSTVTIYTKVEKERPYRSKKNADTTKYIIVRPLERHSLSKA